MLRPQFVGCFLCFFLVRGKTATNRRKGDMSEMDLM